MKFYPLFSGTPDLALSNHNRLIRFVYVAWRVDLEIYQPYIIVTIVLTQLFFSSEWLTSIVSCISA